MTIEVSRIRPHRLRRLSTVELESAAINAFANSASGPKMKLIFWLCFALTCYAYLGYLLSLSLYVRFRGRPVLKAPFSPTVSVIIAAHNEQANLPAKLRNLRQLDYPQKLLQVVIASDGSTDATISILRENEPFVLPVILDQARGKANALNAAVSHATGDILLFLDVRQVVDTNALRELVANFSDPQVGAVSGELLLQTPSGQPAGDALGIYWKIEKAVRKLESASGSVVGVTGAIYAIRRNLYTPIPIGTLLDDVFVPMNIARSGQRVIFEPAAIARDYIFSEKGREFSRKVRTLTGNYQLIRLAPWLLSPANPLLFRLISHKLLRLLVPLLLLLLLITSALADGPFYRAIFWVQVLFYLLAAFGSLAPSIKKFKPVGVATTFVMLNAAAAVAFYNFVTGRNKVWIR
jgi:poly-beta-1,6-N-acetyl-D-glucosamine synthase